MSLTVVASQAEIVNAINTFNPQYHNDYLLVNRLAVAYLESATVTKAALLAQELGAVLIRWGAGRRQAPCVQTQSVLQAVLLDSAFHASLLRFSGGKLASLRVAVERGRMVDGQANSELCEAFDKNLISVLTDISDRLLVSNTNVTYPMKVLLLLTGFMPALDSQVRKGLGSAGFTGTSKTQFLMPKDMSSIEALKLTRLPFYLGECFTENSTLLIKAATLSQYPWLAGEPGRLLDVLFFMQGSADTQIFEFARGGIFRWHALP